MDTDRRLKMSNEFDTREEVEETLYQLIELGLVEAYGVDEDGAFIYNLTDKGRENEDADIS
jgi:DNA-binding PadR family transcriptional regulator